MMRDRIEQGRKIRISNTYPKLITQDPKAPVKEKDEHTKEK